MEPRRGPLEANHNEQHERNGASPRPGRNPYNGPRQNQQIHRNEGGRQNEHRPGGRNAQPVGGYHRARLGAQNEHRGERQHEQRYGGPHGHRGGRQNEQRGGGHYVHDRRGQIEHRGGANGGDEQRGGGHQGQRPRLQNEQTPGDHQGNNRRRENYNQEGRGNPRKQPENQRQIKRLGYKALEELLEKDPSEVAITLATHNGLNDLLSATEMRPDFVELLCKALCRACTARLERQSIQHLLEKVKSSNYTRVCIPQYIMGMMTEPVPERRQRYPESIQNILHLLQEIISIFPASSIRETSMLVALIPNSLNTLRAAGIEVGEHIEQSLERVTNCIQHLQERRREGTLRVDTHMVIGPEVPLEDFRTLSVYPTFDEIHLGANPFLRPNNIKNKFESTDLYLDTHFRLLREDFVRPLRNGIQEILHQHDDRSIRKQRFDDIRVYFDTHIITPLCTSSGISYKIQFDVTPFKRLRWQNSKRLLYGSLVCLSQDSFETFLFATVLNRDANELEKGEVQLQFCEQSRELLAETQPKDSFIMVETTAYFEAYRHVLEGLKEMNAQDLPFQKYIVSCEAEVGAPRYLNAGVQYDLSCMVSKEEKAIGASMNKINILNPLAWPSKESLGFDESQIEAVRLALTKELAIIQGPPGTGKTYVGLKIAEALLTNTDVWQLNGSHYPMLVVCYTNHALDQFLEGIHKFLRNGIVRIGGRSSSEILKQFNVRELRQKVDRRNSPIHLRRAFAEIKEEMKESELKLQEGGQLLECSTAGIIHEKFLQKNIKEDHWDSLHRVMEDDNFYRPTTKKMSVIIEWLGLGSSPFIQTADPVAAVPQQNPEEVVEEQTEEEEFVKIQEQAEIIEDERVLDDEDEEETVRRKKRQKTKEEDNEIAKLVLAMSLKDKTQQKEEGEWQMTRDQKKRRNNRIKNELKKVKAMTKAEVDQIEDVWSLDLNTRWKLYRYWTQLYQRDIRLRILAHEQNYQTLADRLSELRQREDLQILKEARVIGMTTTGAAKYRRIIQEVQPRIVIVEEAAEVLEAHTITTLSSACQHLILIGDHQQLRPSANVYDLAKNFHLEVSLFERLINSQLPFVRLNYQHRMRPDIARLLVPHIYTELENHSSVLNYENIKGVSSNLFFVKHNFLEQEIKDGKSHQNLHEAEFVVELCKYFLNQEYKPSQITILTTYTGQLFCLRKLMPVAAFSGVKVHVVDKYQGEENDIVLLSLVRSNKEGKVGFLKIANRICVALSRAKKGLYCIGNMDMLSSVHLWSSIFGTLQQKAQVGNHLMLYCQNHPETNNLVSCAADFKSVPEGGCNKKCEFRLECGHVCTRICHPYDPEHKEYQCNKDCQKECQDGHRCKYKCFEPCGKCMVEVEKLILSCGHLQMVPCSISENKFRCTLPCEKTLQCGHPCNNRCGYDCEVRCPIEISAELKCGHMQQIKCWQKRDLDMGMPVRCRNPCNAMLSCGHQCSGTCDSCFQGRFHMGCKYPCNAVLVCSHECREPCTRECPPCSRPCQNRCVHSMCKKECGEKCVPCMEPCKWSCQHYKCTQLCSEPCDRPPCDAPCDKQLKCKHPCIGLCGEPCPKKCRVCHKDEVTEIFFGFEEDEDARFVQLEDCKHILESSGMDMYMRTQNDSEEGSAIKLKECPKCKTPIRRNLRYGTIINETLCEIEKVKARILGPASVKSETLVRIRTILQESVDVKRAFYDEYKELEEQLDNPKTQLRSLLDMENKIQFYDRLAKLLSKFSKVDKIETLDLKARLLQIRRAKLFSNFSKVDEIETFKLEKRLLQIKGWLMKHRSFFSEQELSDLQTEIARFTYLVQLLVKCKVAQVRITPEIQREITLLRDLLESNKQFTEENETFVKTKLKELNKSLPDSGLALTEDERVKIVKAMGLTKGHWFKCPNGHIYCITECGGAMQQSQCPECKEEIGGTNHALLPTNRLAPEMDGAQHAAWSETANNMGNFQNIFE